MTIRIAMITDHSDHGDKADGGVQAVTRYLVSGFVNRDDIELHVISFRYGIPAIKTIQYDGYLRYLLPGSRFGAATGYWLDQRILNRFLQGIRPDIVHGQGIGQNGIVAARSSYPTVLTVHGIMAEEANFRPGVINRSRHRLMNLWSEYYCVRKARHTILISPYVREYFGTRLAGKQYLIPNPVGESFFALRRRPENGRILFAGRIRYLKGLLDLVRAFARVADLPKAQLILAGSLDDQLFVQRLRQEVRDLGIEKQVAFRGLLSEEEVHEELGRCAFLVLPSYQETAPMVIAEAMAAGVPVIASNVGGVRHQVVDGQSGFLVEPRDVQKLAERLGELLSDHDRRQAFGDSARLVAGDAYRTDRVVDRTVEVYEHVLSGRSTDNPVTAQARHA